MGIDALEKEIGPLRKSVHHLAADKERLVMDLGECRGKLATFQEESGVLREHVGFVGKMWNQLAEKLVMDKTQVEHEFKEMKQVLEFAKDTIDTHEKENHKNLAMLTM